jgi:hypothetical protein
MIIYKKKNQKFCVLKLLYSKHTNLELRFIVRRERTIHDKVCLGLLRSCASFLPFAVTIVHHLGTAKGACVPTAITIELFANYFSNIKFLYITYNKPPICRMILYSTCSPNVCYLIIISILQ